MKEKKNKKKSLLDYIFQFAGAYKGAYRRCVVLAVVGVFFALVPYYIMGDMVGKLLGGERSTGYYVTGAMIMAVAWILRVLFHTLSTNISHRTTFRLISNVRISLVDKLSRVPLGTVQGIPSGEMKNIICERTDSMEPVLAHVVPEFTANICAPIFLFVYIITLDWRMALISLVTLPVAAIALAMMFRDSQARFNRTQETTRVLNDTAVEYIGGIEVIKAFGKGESSYQRFVDAARDNSASFVEWMRSCVVPFSVGMVIAPSTLLAVLPAGAFFAMHGTLSLTDFVMILVLACGLITPLITVMSYNDDITKASKIFGEIDEILELPEMTRPGQSLEMPVDNSITLQNVRFGYGEKEVLHGVDLHVPDGSVTALVGPSGSGKSTIARLIASLWDVDDGSISIGGVDIRRLASRDYNSRVAYVSQESFLFDTTVMENIRMGDPGASDEQVREIARKSGCYEFIMGLEKGFETQVGGSGAHLSGGERQRISIARAMLKNAPVLILDEATAYTDPENEAVIQRAVSRLSEGKTLIVIAHRLSTITNSDQIAVVEDGMVKDTAKHEELLERSELYRRMWEAHNFAKDSGIDSTAGTGADSGADAASEYEKDDKEVRR